MITEDRPLLLGSASPRRSSILASLGIPFVVLAGEAAETVLFGEAPLAYLERVTLAKLRDVRARRAREGSSAARAAQALVVADTIVVIDEQIVGKPADEDDARATLGRLVGRTHTVFTRYLVGAAAGALEEPPWLERTVSTSVRLRAASDEEIALYAATGEGLDKAGAYAAQGIGAFLVEAVVGSYSNVVGLPACELVSDLRRQGLLPAFPLVRRQKGQVQGKM